MLYRGTNFFIRFFESAKHGKGSVSLACKVQGRIMIANDSDTSPTAAKQANSDGLPNHSDKQPVVLIAGALVVDDIAIPEENLVIGASNPVRWESRTGGVAANVARVVAQQHSVSLIAAIGEDVIGRQLCHALQNAGVSIDPVAFSQQATGRYSAILDKSSELFIGLAQTQINEHLSWLDIKARFPQTGIKAIVVDANLNEQCINETLQGVSEMDISAIPTKIALAVSPAKASRLKTAASTIDILFCNRAEAAALTNLNQQSTLNTFAQALQTLGFKRFIITDGAHPMLVQDINSAEMINAPSVQHIHTVNGAGDAFAGGTINAFLIGQVLSKAARDSGRAAAQEILSGMLTAPLIR